MDKVLVRDIKIKHQKERILFQINLPENAREITGVLVTVFGLNFLTNDSRPHAGDLRLAIADEGDIFFSEEVKTYQQQPRIDEGDTNYVNFNWSRAAWGKRATPLSISIDPTVTFIDCYYEDVLLGMPGYKIGNTYTVKIYLYYKR